MGKKGKVSLVGAGPGDPELITIRGARTLAACDAVVYDRLAPLELIVSLPPRIQRHYVGKSQGHHSLPQAEINNLLAELAEKGLKVVRLKGGDPFVFGRGGEEALYLKKRGVPFEVIPGITAGIAAPAYAGIPVTYREKSVFTLLLTAHEAADKEELQVPWEWVAKARNGSIVGYMGVKQLSAMVETLVAAGMDPSTPASLVEQGTTGIQKSVTGTLRDLPKLAETVKISPPAVVIIGEVVSLQEELAWFGRSALSGKKVMVTRPADQAGEMYSMLRSHGAQVLPLPTIATEDSVDEARWVRIKSLFDANAGNRKSRTNWLVFTSENGVRYLIGQLLDHQSDLRFTGGFRIAAVGYGTDRELVKHGLKADFIPSKVTTATLAAELSAHLSSKAATVIRVRGNLGDDQVERALEATGAIVIPLQVYRTFTASWDQGMQIYLDENPPDVITFTSGSTVTGFLEILGKKRAKKLADQAVVASIGPMTTRIAAEEGITVTVEAEEHSVAGLVDAILKHFVSPT